MALTSKDFFKITDGAEEVKIRLLPPYPEELEATRQRLIRAVDECPFCKAGIPLTTLHK